MGKEKEKVFQYDVLIGPEDLCNREEERKRLLKAAQRGKRIILFAPRRHGKTSLVRNVVGADFQKASRRNLLLNFDLMDVSSLAVIEERLQRGLSEALSSKISARRIVDEIVSYFKGFAIEITQNDMTGQPTIRFTSQKKEARKSLSDYFRSIQSISKKYKIMIVLDEFHDIAFVPEAEALFRMFLQEMGDASVFILGSKRHLLQMMFQDANAPLFHYGDEMHLEPISVDDWVPYFGERLSPAGLKMERDALVWLVKVLNDVPNAVCEVGAWLLENVPQGTTITLDRTKEQLYELVRKKQSFGYFLQGYTEKERAVLKAVAEMGYVNEPGSESFLRIAHGPKSTVMSIIKKMLDLGTIEFEMEKGYRVSNPLLGFYLAMG